MPPLIRRSQSAVPRHAGEDGGHLGHSDAHPLPPRQVPGSLVGAAASTVFMLAPSVHGPLTELAISNRLFPGPAQGGEDTRQRTRPGQAPVNGLLPVRIAADGSVNLMPFAAIPMRYVPACLSTSRCAGTASPRSSAGRPRSCSPPSRPASPARCAMIPVDGGAISSI
jgi:hypothetical protein